MDINCPKCHKDFVELYDYEMTDDDHMVLYCECKECHTSLEVYCALTPITVTESK